MINSYLKWQIIQKITILNIRNKITINELSHKLDINRTHPYFTEVLKYLIDNKAIIEIEKIGSAKIIEINNKIIRVLVKNFSYFEDSVQIIKLTNSLYNI